MLHFTHSKASKRGFTLIEILAATSIMVVVILLVLKLTTDVLDSWTRSSGQLSSNFEGRVALDIITSDLESAVFRRNGNIWLEVRYEGVEDRSTGGSLSHLDRLPVLYFFSPVMDRPKYKNSGSGTEPIPGDVCAVSYRVLVQNPFDAFKSNRRVYGFYRSVIDAETTFNDALDIDFDYDSNSGTFGVTLENFWEDSGFSSYKSSGFSQDENRARRTPIDEEGDPTSDFLAWVRSPSNFLSANVIDFRTEFYYFKSDDGEVHSSPIPHGQEFWVGNKVYFGDQVEVNPINYDFRNGDKPSIDKTNVGSLAYVDVFLTVLSGEGAKILQSIDDGLVTDNGNRSAAFRALVEEHSTTFTRRISLVSNPL